MRIEGLDTGLKLNVRLNVLLLLFMLAITALISVSGAVNYLGYRKSAIDNYTNKHINDSQRTREYYRLALDKLQHNFIKKEQENIEVLQKYFDLYKRDKSTFDLQKISQKLNKESNSSEYQVFLINKQFKIEKSSYQNDVGYDLGKYKGVAELLESVFAKKIDIDVSPIVVDSSSMQFKRYLLRLSDDGKYLLQIAYVLSFEEITNGLVKPTEDSANFELFLVTADLIAPIVFRKRALEKNSLDEGWKQTQKFLEEMSSDLAINRENISGLTQADAQAMRIPINDELSKMFNNDRLNLAFNHNAHRFAVYSITDGVFNKSNETKLILRTYYSTEELEVDLQNALRNVVMPTSLSLLTLFGMCCIVYFYILVPLTKILSDVGSNRRSSIGNSLVREITSLRDGYNELHQQLNSEIEKNCELLRLNKRFLADTVHQVRTPLTNILMNAELIKKFSADPKIDKYIDMIDSSVNMLSVSYEDLSYINTGNSVEYEQNKVSLSEVLKRRISFFSLIADMAHKSIVSSSGEDVYVFINEIELERLIDNNISNGIKYADANKPIAIDIRKVGGSVTLKFSTFGSEIVEKIRVFDEGYREEHGKRGYGLGLSMVKTICTKNNVDYFVEYCEGQNVFTYTFKFNSSNEGVQRKNPFET